MLRLSSIPSQLLKLQFSHLRYFATEPHWHKPFGAYTGIFIYNGATKHKVPLIIPNDNFITWYTCGPTVYDSAHLGHASCYVKFDIIQRILREFFKFNLVTAMNITDIDDKIIKKSQESGKNWHEISRYYENEFWSDLKKLNVTEPNLKIRVTEQIPKIVAFIDDIIKKGGAYVGNDGSVYFDVNRYSLYGKLQKVNKEQLQSESGDVEMKHFPADFALWKARKDAHEPSWSSPWGRGRPGWHIECSALASFVFGKCIDFHAGGVDLKFPHHENEEAQSCVYHNTTQWVNYWMHAGHLSVKGQTDKMSKSLKNTIPIDEMLSKYTADDFRMACMLSNYKNSMEYSDELMRNSKNTVHKFQSFKADCEAYLVGKKKHTQLDSDTILQTLNYTKTQLHEFLKDDFDTARSISVLLDLVSSVSRGINANYKTTLISGTYLDAVAAANNFVEASLRSFGFKWAEEVSTVATVSTEHEIDMNGLLEDLLESRRIIRERAVAAKSKDLFQICDELRSCLEQHGILIRDHSQGSSWKLLAKKK